MKQLGLMVDCSRNSVLTVEAAKRLVDILSSLGYTYLELYTEDTYEVAGEPRFGICRGRYTREELRELDAYCIAHRMVLKPCIQTLGHLEGMFRWLEYNSIRDCANILLCEDERTYTFLDHVFASLAESFTCREVNIGMDEAFLVGHGKYYRAHGHVPPIKIMHRHLTRVVEIAARYGFRCEMWGDLFRHMAQERAARGIPFESAAELLPEGVKLIYWDYYRIDAREYEACLADYSRLTDHIGFAGGIWTWRGFCPGTSYALRATEAAMRACETYHVEDFLQTAWGDDGGECSVFAALPAIVATAAYARGCYDREELARLFRRTVGMDMDVFCALDLPNTLNAVPEATANPGNYLLYNDPFLGLCDGTVREGQGAFFASLAERYERSVGNRRWGYLYRMERDLCRTLAIKCDLGLRTRRLYQAGDREGLLALADGDYMRCVRRLRQFYRSFKSYWMHDKKPYGFEVQDVRLGGLMLRLEECARTLRAYCRGETDAIPELADTPPYLTMPPRETLADVILYHRSCTPAKLVHEIYN